MKLKFLSSVLLLGVAARRKRDWDGCTRSETDSSPYMKWRVRCIIGKVIDEAAGSGDHWANLHSIIESSLMDGVSSNIPEIKAMVDHWDDQNRALCNGDEPECGGFFSLKSIWGYGCWCNFGDDAGKGRAQPVDKIDKLCYDLQQCYRCAVRDARGSGGCVPWDQTYNIDVHKSKKNINMQCDESNDNECSFHTCCCEIHFLSNFWSLLVNSAVNGDPSPYNKDNLHRRGFNFDLECPAAGSGPPANKECCGDYPLRRLYNTDRLQCCTDGSIVPVASSCP